MVNIQLLGQKNRTLAVGVSLILCTTVVCRADQLWRGISLLDAGRVDEAIVVLKAAAERTGSSEAWLWLLAGYYKKFDPDLFDPRQASKAEKEALLEAIACCDRALASCKGRSEAERVHQYAATFLATLANWLRLEGQLEEAMARCNKALEHSPNWPRARIVKARILRDMATSSQSVADRRRFLEEARGLLSPIADGRLESKFRENARGDLLRIEVELGKVYLDMQDLDRAEELLLRAAGKVPDASGYYWLGQLCTIKFYRASEGEQKERFRWKAVNCFEQVRNFESMRPGVKVPDEWEEESARKILELTRAGESKEKGGGTAAMRLAADATSAPDERTRLERLRQAREAFRNWYASSSEDKDPVVLRTYQGVCVVLGTLCESAGHLDEAVDYYEEAVAVLPDALSYCFLGMLKTKQAELLTRPARDEALREGIEMLARALDAGEPESYADRAREHAVKLFTDRSAEAYRNGRFEEALRFAEAASEFDEDHPLTLYWMLMAQIALAKQELDRKSALLQAGKDCMDKLLDVYSSYEPQDKERLGEFVSSARKLLAATLAAESDYDGAIDLMGGEVRENPSAQAYFELAHLCLAASWRTDDTSARARRERQALWSFKQVLDMHPPGEMADEARKWVNELSLVRNRVGCLSPVDQTGSEAYSARIIQALRLPVCVANGYEFVGRLSAGDITQAFYEAETHRMAWILETLAKSLEITESKVEGKPAATARLVVGLVLYDVEEREQVAATELTFYSDPPGTDPLRENRLRKAVQILLKTVQQELPERASRFVAQNVKPSTDPSR